MSHSQWPRCRIIDGYAGHKAIQAVVVIGPGLLLNRRSGEIAAGHIELIPANTRWLGAVRVGTNRIGRPQRFRATAVLVNHRRHDFIAKGLDSIARSLLRHNCKASGRRESIHEWVNCDLCVRCMIGSDTESRICRRNKINMEKPGVDLSQAHAAISRAVDGQHHFISDRQVADCRAKVRGNKAIGIAHARETQGKSDDRGIGVAIEHRRAIERKNAHASEREVGTIKQIDCQVICTTGRRLRSTTPSLDNRLPTGVAKAHAAPRRGTNRR